MTPAAVSVLGGLPILLGVSCWLLMLVIGAFESFSRAPPDPRWRHWFWAYTGASLAIGATLLLSQGLAPGLSKLIGLHGLPVLIAGRPATSERISKLSRLGNFIGGCFVLAMIGGAVETITRLDSHHAGSEVAPVLATRSTSATGEPTASNGSTPLLSVPSNPDQRNRFGIGYHVKNGVFESAISGLRVTPPPGFAVLGREEWINPALTGPEVIVHDADHSLQVFIENVRASEAKASLRLLRHMARAGTQMVASATFSDETWSLDVLGETRTFETIVSPERIIRDAYFGFEGRAYVVSIQYDPKLQGVKEKAAPIFAGFGALPAVARAQLRKQLDGTPDVQGLVGAQSSVRGRTLTNFEHRFGWTAPTGLWRFLPDRALQLLGPTVAFGAVDDERGYRLLGLVIPMPNLDPRQVIERMTLEFQPGADPVVPGAAPDGFRYLSRRGTVSREGLAGPIHVAVLQLPDRTFVLRLDGEPDTRDESTEVFEQVVAGWRHKVPSIASEHAAGVYLDHRMGFTFREPPGWKVSANNSEADGIPTTDVTWTREGTGQVAISAAFHAGSQGAGEELAEVIYTGVRDTLRSAGTQSLRESRESLAGLQARHLTFTQDNAHVEVYVLARAGVAFLLRSEGINATPAQLLRDNFELLP